MRENIHHQVKHFDFACVSPIRADQRPNATILREQSGQQGRFKKPQYRIPQKTVTEWKNN
jgi:hypothetical protein